MFCSGRPWQHTRKARATKSSPYFCQLSCHMYSLLTPPLRSVILLYYWIFPIVIYRKWTRVSHHTSFIFRNGTVLRQRSFKIRRYQWTNTTFATLVIAMHCNALVKFWRSMQASNHPSRVIGSSRFISERSARGSEIHTLDVVACHAMLCTIRQMLRTYRVPPAFLKDCTTNRSPPPPTSPEALLVRHPTLFAVLQCDPPTIGRL
jgi:hypothetical protein